VKDEGRRS
jgi:hypothetical protein